MYAVAVGEWGFFAVAQQVVAVVEAGSVGRPQVGDRRAGIADPQDRVLRGYATVDRVNAEVDLGFDALLAIGAGRSMWSPCRMIRRSGKNSGNSTVSGPPRAMTRL